MIKNLEYFHYRENLISQAKDNRVRFLRLKNLTRKYNILDSGIEIKDNSETVLSEKNKRTPLQRIEVWNNRPRKEENGKKGNKIGKTQKRRK